MNINQLSTENTQLANELLAAVHFIGSKNWCPATGGNFSARLNSELCLITQSAKFKDTLKFEDLMISNLDNQALDPNLKPSAETGLHTQLYKLDANINCVLHTHSVTSTVLSRLVGNKLVIQGFEMQKSLSGNKTHEQAIEVMVFDNNQDIPALAKQLLTQWREGNITQPGFLVRGHGLYAWGNSVAEAKRHVEGFEFLFSCVLQEKLLSAGSAQ